MLLGDDQAVTLSGPGLPGFGIGREQQVLQRMALSQMYVSDGADDWLGRRVTSALDAADRFDATVDKDASPLKGDYAGEFGNHAKAFAQLLRSPLPLAAAAIDFGGWDTHGNQGDNGKGRIADLFGQLNKGINGLLLDSPRPLRIVVMSEFGRRLRENANHGTDHGHGGVMFVVGHGVHGGRVYGPWPGLATDQLYERADLAVATDFRQVLWEATQGLAPKMAPATIFPGFHPGKELRIFA